MKIIISQKLPRILKSKKKLETTLNIKITNRGKEVKIEGSPEDEYIAEKVIDAINFGFPLPHALTIKKEENLFEIINIKDYTKRQNLKSIRSRIIGTKGKTLKTLGNLAECYLEINENQIGIISPPEFLENAQQGIISIIQGAKQSNVYTHLEKTRPKPIQDLGLREMK